MGRRNNQENLQPLPWASDNNAAVWKLVSALEEPENRRKLFGKNPSEVKCVYSVSGTRLANSKPCGNVRTHPGGIVCSGLCGGSRGQLGDFQQAVRPILQRSSFNGGVNTIRTSIEVR